MKRWITWVSLVAMLLTLTACSACGEEEPPMSDGATAVGRKLGMDTISTVTMEGEKNAHLQVTAVALVLDANGNIADCAVDQLGFTVTVEDGLPQVADSLLSKLELGDQYFPNEADTGMSDTATRSWAQQVEAFCDYAEGKTPAQMTGLATTDGKSGEIEGCDLIITDFIRALDGAAKEAKVQKLTAGDDLEIAISAEKAQAYSHEKPQFDVEIAAVTVGEGDRITGCEVDTLQAKLTVAEGIFSAVGGSLKTKRQEGDGYGMKAASSIKREWYEQADAFGTFALGKTPAELAGVKLDREGKTDGITGCTVTVTGMVKNVVKAADKA